MKYIYVIEEFNEIRYGVYQGSLEKFRCDGDVYLFAHVENAEDVVVRARNRIDTDDITEIVRIFNEEISSYSYLESCKNGLYGLMKWFRNKMIKTDDEFLSV